jgi:hypothetical protein
MDEKETEVFDQIEGITSVEPGALEDFKREMTEQVIPEIVRVVEERRTLAAESRHRKLEVLIARKPEQSK